MDDAARPQARRPATPATQTRRHGADLSEVAYDRLEGAIVACELPPGLLLSIPDLQQRTGVGRTPTHLAVRQLAADTLVTIRPRHGLQIAPVDLDRARTLLQLRRDLERFVVRLAGERADRAQRDQLAGIAARLRTAGSDLTIDAFNRLDRRIDQLVLAAAGEAFLEHTLRPLHTISRRIGWIYHTHVRPREGLTQTLACHLAVLDALIAHDTAAAVKASDRLTAFSDSMCRVLGRNADPALLDCRLPRHP